MYCIITYIIINSNIVYIYQINVNEYIGYGEKVEEYFKTLILILTLSQ